MKKIKKQLQIILYVWVWLLSFSMADAAEAITDEYWITTADRGKIEQRYRSLGIYEVAKKTVSRKEEQYGNYTYRVWYPKRLETENRKWPMVFLLNGTTSTCDLDEPIFEHLASWGFIVVGNTDRNSGLGYSAEWGLELMDKLAADRKSVFFQKIDEENLGIGGHSQGGVGAVKTILFRKGGRRFKTVVTVSAVTESFADKLKMNSWKYDASAVNVPWFMVSGDRLDDRLITPLPDMEKIFQKAKTAMVMGRRSHADHSHVQAEADAYVTAWFRWQLAGDRYAAKAFLGKDAEILTNKGWNHTARKNL